MMNILFMIACLSASHAQAAWENGFFTNRSPIEILKSTQRLASAKTFLKIGLVLTAVGGLIWAFIVWKRGPVNKKSGGLTRKEVFRKTKAYPHLNRQKSQSDNSSNKPDKPLSSQVLREDSFLNPQNPNKLTQETEKRLKQRSLQAVEYLNKEVFKNKDGAIALEILPKPQVEPKADEEKFAVGDWIYLSDSFRGVNDPRITYGNCVARIDGIFIDKMSNETIAVSSYNTLSGYSPKLMEYKKSSLNSSRCRKATAQEVCADAEKIIERVVPYLTAGLTEHGSAVVLNDFNNLEKLFKDRHCCDPKGKSLLSSKSQESFGTLQAHFQNA